MKGITEVKAYRNKYGDVKPTKIEAIIASGTTDLQNWLNDTSSTCKANKFENITGIDIDSKELFSFLLDYMEELSEMIMPYVKAIKKECQKDDNNVKECVVADPDTI